MKRIIILGLVVLLVVLAWTGGWFFLAGQVRQQVAQMADADGVATPRLACQTLNVSGFPFRFDVDCARASVVSGDITAEIAGLRASVLVYRPTHLLASALGPLTLTDAFTGSKSAVAWSGLEASLSLDGWRLGRLSVVAHDASWTDTLLGETLIAQAPTIEAHLLDIPEQHDPERGLAAAAGYIRIQDLAFPNATLTDANTEIELELSGIPDDVRRFGESDLLPAWQQSGGRLQVVSIRGTDATSSLDAKGTLGLDNRGQVEGQIDIDSTGVAERLGPLLAEPYRTLVLGNPTATGAHANVLNFRAGGIYSGLIPIAAIPPLY